MNSKCCNKPIKEYEDKRITCTGCKKLLCPKCLVPGKTTGGGYFFSTDCTKCGKELYSSTV